MIDLHSHIAPGLDDGVATIEQARELARAAFAEGVTAIAATPHVRADYPTRPEQMEGAVTALRADFHEQGIALDVLHGGELDLEHLQTLDDDALRRFTIGQNGRYALLETPYAGWPLGLRATIFELGLRDIRAILAHPERNPEVQSDPERLRELVDAGVLVQLTAASLDGRLGRRSRDAAHALLERGLVHLVASDAHAPEVRAFGLASARSAIGDQALADYLFAAAPAAIVAGSELPPRPGRRPRRSGFLRFRR